MKSLFDNLLQSFIITDCFLFPELCIFSISQKKFKNGGNTCMVLDANAYDKNPLSLNLHATMLLLCSEIWKISQCQLDQFYYILLKRKELENMI